MTMDCINSVEVDVSLLNTMDSYLAEIALRRHVLKLHIIIAEGF